MTPTRWATMANLPLHEKTAHVGVDGCSERRCGVRLLNNDDREIQRHTGISISRRNDTRVNRVRGRVATGRPVLGRSTDRPTAGWRRRRWVPCSAMAESHLSPQAYKRLQDELEERSTTRRLELSHAIERARELGDLSENADYDAAKNEHGLNEARIRQLEATLKNAI